jgi:CheY-like chemotaxis protein
MRPGEPVVILLAEDDEGHALLIKRNLQRAGIRNEIVHLTNGQDALDYVHRHPRFLSSPTENPLLIILDINLPRLNGIEVLTEIKVDPRTRKTPVIMLTTTDDPREVNRCYELGCSVYITKPVEYEAFIEAVRRLGMLLEIVQMPNEPRENLLP